MAFGSIELTTISRAQDYSAIKQNEDNKPLADQANGLVQVQKNETQKTREVHTGDNAQWQERKPDAREKGQGEYCGDGGKRRKPRPGQGTAAQKQGGFDIKI